MKKLMFVVSLFSLSLATANNICTLKDNKIQEIDVIVSNIQNVETTRTPEGRSYRRKDFVCDKLSSCKIVESPETFLKYLPNHPDADQNGYVLYANINLNNELKKLITAQNSYLRLNTACANSTKN